jgi:hypothetical protein
MPAKQTFHINNCQVTPRGNNAQMSKSGCDNLPYQAEWRNDDVQYDYFITLPDGVWALASGQASCMNSLSFTVPKGVTSCTFQLLGTAPVGDSHYALIRADGQRCKQLHPFDPDDPDVIINS